MLPCRSASEASVSSQYIKSGRMVDFSHPLKNNNLFSVSSLKILKLFLKFSKERSWPQWPGMKQILITVNLQFPKFLSLNTNSECPEGKQ